jgi:hypothetical protein
VGVESASPVVPGRRRFLQLLGVAGVSNLVGVPVALAQSAVKRVTKSTKPGMKPSAKPQPATPPKPEEEISDDARALASIIRRRYGQHLDAKQLESVTRDLDGDLKAGQALRKTKLQNGDEPDFTFKA